ncbi:MAG: hypothetical protein AB7T49_09310 [Oligoflexales bacterium]
MFKAISGLFLGAVLLVGCVTRGRDFPSDLNWIKVKQTSQSDVASTMGEPYEVGSSSGTPTWTYGYYKFQLFGESYTKELKFYWDPESKIRDYSFTSSFPKDRQRSTQLRPAATPQH